MNSLAWLQLLQLADSALPVGALAHSFGLETLVAEARLTVDELALFLRDYLDEAGGLEGAFCRAAHRLGVHPEQDLSLEIWLDLNRHLGALKPARESRTGSATLGRRLLRLAWELSGAPLLHAAQQAARGASVDVHHSPAFGLAGGALGLDEQTTVLAYLHQSLAGLISAGQRLLPLGQSQASRLLWELKPALIAAAERSQARALNYDAIACFTPLLDLGGMRHPMLATRLFIS